MSGEEIVNCPACESETSLKKLVPKFALKTKAKAKKSTGDLTESFIKEAKEDLKQQKKELLKQT